MPKLTMIKCARIFLAKPCKVTQDTTADRSQPRGQAVRLRLAEAGSRTHRQVVHRYRQRNCGDS